MAPDSFFSIESECEYEFKEKASRFLGFAARVQSTEECAEQLRKLRKRFFDATHHTYAYLLAGGEMRHSDDGEPSGTAGTRILNAIERRSFRNVICVVIRWFGGTKLGVGPLGKAYAHAADGTLAEAKQIAYKKTFPATLTARYNDTGAVYRAFSLFPAKIINTSFASDAVFTLHLPFDSAHGLRNELDRMIEGRYQLRIFEDEVLYEQSAI